MQARQHSTAVGRQTREVNDQPFPTAGIRAAFNRAAQAHDAARTAGPQPQFDRQPQTASRQVAPAQGTTTVEQAIASAARQTSVDFDFLLAQAQVESSMDPDARARTSSATGLYQFIDSTWLGTMQRHGERFGLGDVASQIGTNSRGSAFVSDPAARESILALRNDPQIASFMAAGLAEDNRAHLAPILGRQPEHSELYLAHFLGAGGAGRFLSEMANDPNQSAASLFRRPAAANRPVFYEPGGSPRSLTGVLDYLSGKLERARADASTSLPENYALASLTASNPATIAAAQFGITNDTALGSLNAPVLTGRSRPTMPASPSLSLASPGSQGSMSGLLRSAFGDTNSGSTDRGASQVRRAYDQLRALGL